MEITDTPTEQLPTLPDGAITWDEIAGEWLVDGRPVAPGPYQRAGERIHLLDPANPGDCLI